MVEAKRIKDTIYLDIKKSELEYGRGISVRQAASAFMEGFMESARAKRGTAKYAGIKNIAYRVTK
jgi:hypothetical protein